MATLTPDPSFYPSPKDAIGAPAEELAFVSMLNAKDDGKPDALGVVDVKAGSPTYGELVGQLDMTGPGDELHHFGWNACSSCLCPYAPHPHVERRYLVIPGIHSSRIYIVDTKPDPRNPQIIKTIEADELKAKAGYSSPHTVHCGPDGIYMSALGNADGDGPGGVFTLDQNTFEVVGQWEKDRGSQHLAYDFWWHLGHDIMVTSTWGTPNMVMGGLDPELLLASKYGHKLHIWDLKSRGHLQELDLGEQHQMALELRPAHDPAKAYGFLGVVVSLEDLSASVWLWHHNDDGNGAWAIEKVITIPAEPADADDLPELLKGFGAVPPLITDINLTVDDQTLYVSCWGTGQIHRYNVADPFNPELTDTVDLGGIVRRAAHPAKPDQPLNGGPQMVEVSRDGSRVYFTNSLYSPWDEQFYPDGIQGWMVKMDADPEGSISLDPDFFVETGDMRTHQVRLQGGDASSDSYCFS